MSAEKIGKYMAITFEKAPLVELIAELKWDVNDVHPRFPVSGNVLHQQFVNPTSINSTSEFFTQFGTGANKASFSRTERLVPELVPLFAEQIVLRFRPTDVKNNSALYQIGPGIFSTNAMPPYRSWQEHRPILVNGVKMLLDARSSIDKDKPFTSLSLRYLDAFKAELTQGRDIATFARDVLGFNVILPSAIEKLVSAGKTFKPTIQLLIPMDGGFTMNIAIGEGVVNNELAVIMDTTVISIVPIAPTMDGVMGAFDASHAIIHNLFLELTQKLAGLMKCSDESI